MNQELLRSRITAEGIAGEHPPNATLPRRQHIKSLLTTYGSAGRPFKIVNELITLIQEEPLFQPLANNYRVLSEVCQKMELRNFRKDEVIYQTRMVGDYFYVLLSGTVHLTIREEI